MKNMKRNGGNNLDFLLKLAFKIKLKNTPTKLDNINWM